MTPCSECIPSRAYSEVLNRTFAQSNFAFRKYRLSSLPGACKSFSVNTMVLACTYVKALMNNLEATSSCGNDEVNKAFLIHASANGFIMPQCLFSQFHISGTLPKDLKPEKKCTSLQTRKCNNPTNFRPLLLTSASSNILEQVFFSSGKISGRNLFLLL